MSRSRSSWRAQVDSLYNSNPFHTSLLKGRKERFTSDHQSIATENSFDVLLRTSAKRYVIPFPPCPRHPLLPELESSPFLPPLFYPGELEQQQQQRRPSINGKESMAALDYLESSLGEAVAKAIEIRNGSNEIGRYIHSLSFPLPESDRDFELLQTTEVNLEALKSSSLSLVWYFYHFKTLFFILMIT